MSANLVEMKIANPKLPDVGRYARAAEALTIESPADSISAQEVRASVNTQLKNLIEQRMEITRPMDAAKAKVMDLFRPITTALENAIKVFDRKIVAWDDAQEEIRKKRQRDEDAAAEAERVRLQAISDKAAEKGQEGKAERFQERAEAVVANVVPTEVARAGGVSIASRWSFEIIDPKKIEPLFLMPNEVAIGKVVRAMGKEAQAVVGAGVRIIEAKSVSSRRS